MLADGLTQYMHDAISWEVTEYTSKLENTRLIYPPEILAYECKINEYTFHIVHDTKYLPHVGMELNNCVATYRQKVLAHTSIIAFVKHGKKYVACIEIVRDKHIVQARQLQLAIDGRGASCLPLLG